MVSDEGPYFDDFDVEEEIVTDGRTVTGSDVVTFKWKVMVHRKAAAKIQGDKLLSEDLRTWARWES